MNAMKIPGFTAESSLYETSRVYHKTRIDRSLVATEMVLPQLPKSTGFCMADCDPNDYQCLFDCMEPVDTSGSGGPSSPPELICGPCIRGRQRCGIPGLGFKTGPCGDW